LANFFVQIKELKKLEQRGCTLYNIFQFFMLRRLHFSVQMRVKMFPALFGERRIIYIICILYIYYIIFQKAEYFYLHGGVNPSEKRCRILKPLSERFQPNSNDEMKAAKHKKKLRIFLHIL